MSLSLSEARAPCGRQEVRKELPAPAAPGPGGGEDGGGEAGRHRQAARHLRRDTTAWGLRPLAPELTVHTGYPRTEKAVGPPERPSGSRTWAMPGRLCWAPRQEVLRSHPTCWLSGSRRSGARALLPGEPSIAGPPGAAHVPASRLEEEWGAR